MHKFSLPLRKMEQLPSPPSLMTLPSLPPPPLSPHKGEFHKLRIKYLQPWMNECYLRMCFAKFAEVTHVSILRDSVSNKHLEYAIIEFSNELEATKAYSLHCSAMPRARQSFSLDFITDNLITSVRNFSEDFNDDELLSFVERYFPLVVRAKVAPNWWPRGYGFVKFGNLEDKIQAMKKFPSYFPGEEATSSQLNASYETKNIEKGEFDDQKTIIVGNLDPYLRQENLCEVFSVYGSIANMDIRTVQQNEIVGIVEFNHMENAEKALNANGVMLGKCIADLCMLKDWQRLKAKGEE